MCIDQNKVHIKLAEAVNEILHMYSSLCYDKIPIVVLMCILCSTLKEWNMFKIFSYHFISICFLNILI